MTTLVHAKSRVGRLPIVVPAGVQVILNGQEITVKGKQGELKYKAPAAVKVEHQESEIKIVPVSTGTNANALAGTARALLNNMVQGVSQGFEKKLVLVGVGYRAKVQGNTLSLSVGYSHPVDILMPAGIKVESPSQTEVVIKGADKHLVAQTAANIREVRPPEPYKGKGIRYDNERIQLKEAKKK